MVLSARHIVILRLLALGCAAAAASPNHHPHEESFAQLKSSAPEEETLGDAPTEEVKTVTPVQKVVTLIEDLKVEIQEEGTKEAESYNKYACFCKDTTMAKSKEVTDGQDNIESLSATLEEKTALKADKENEVAERKKKAEELQADLDATKEQYAKDLAVYEKTAADLNKAISALQNAIKSIEDSKPDALIELSSSISKSLEIADALGFAPHGQKRKDLAVFLQKAKTGRVDPDDPEYQFHSQGILDILNELLDDFQANKKEVDDDFAETKATYEKKVEDLTGQIKVNSNAISALVEEIENLTKEIAETRADLVEAQGQLEDDMAYVKDLTEQCEARAHDWDQRSKMRGDELATLTKALEIITGKVSESDESVNLRALLQTKQAATVNVTEHNALAFLQESVQATGQLRGSSTSAQLLVRKQKALALLRESGRRLNSLVLASLAAKAAADPFAKVKTLIQNLIERLLREATEEATKKGFCDTELGKAKKDRDYRHEDMLKLSAEIGELEAKEDALKLEIHDLSDKLQGLNASHEMATMMRDMEKEENSATLKEAKEGLKAVTEALILLKDFYKNAAKAQVLMQASPVDEDTSGPGFDSAYKGKQGASSSIIGLLEVIKSDFERTIKMTKQEEKENAADYVKFDRTSKSNMAGKDTKTTLNEEDLEVTEATIEEKYKDLQTASDLLDSALKTIEDLKPMCIDTGMTYAERVQKREEEMDALKKALCILDPDGVEPECEAGL